MNEQPDRLSEFTFEEEMSGPEALASLMRASNASEEEVLKIISELADPEETVSFTDRTSGEVERFCVIVHLKERTVFIVIPKSGQLNIGLPKIAIEKSFRNKSAQPDSTDENFDIIDLTA